MAAIDNRELTCMERATVVGTRQLVTNGNDVNSALQCRYSPSWDEIGYTTHTHDEQEHSRVNFHIWENICKCKIFDKCHVWEHLCCNSVVDICEDEDGEIYRSVFKILGEINRRQSCLTCLDKFFSISLRGFLVTNEMVSGWLEQAFYLDSSEI